MKRLRFKYFLDICLLITLLVTVFTGTLILFYHDLKLINFFNLNKHEWVLIHSFFGFTNVVLVLIHLIDNLAWVKLSSKKIFGKKER